MAAIMEEAMVALPQDEQVAHKLQNDGVDAVTTLFLASSAGSQELLGNAKYLNEPRRERSGESCSTVASEAELDADAGALRLCGAVQKYAWGKPHDESLVAAMAAGQFSSDGAAKAAASSSSERFAELWLGTHRNGSSRALPLSGCTGPQQEQLLKDVIDQDPEFWLGEDCERGDLPYLLKVLSVHQALSIQAHPDKRLAEQLQRRSPEHYPDANHKPEICIPLGHFEALCGFRPTEEVRRHVCEVPELRELCCGPHGPEGQDLRELFSRLMRSDPLVVRRQVGALVERLAAKGGRTPEEELILVVERDYPGDVGVFGIYFLNYVRITPDMPNSFIYCAPNEPHAYLKGDAVECMAISDNVVRAGLTSKHKDVETLLDLLTYRDDLLPELVGAGERVAPHVVLYNPPVDDFLVYEIDGPVPEGLHLPHAAIATCVSGAVSVTFQAAECPDGQSQAAAQAEGAGEGLQRLTTGHSVFSRAGSDLFVLGAEAGTRFFVASY